MNHSLLAQTEQTLSTTKDDAELIDESIFFHKWVCLKNDGVVIGICTGTVHTPPENLLAYMYLHDTHQARKAHIAANGPESSKYPLKTIHVINKHHHITYSCRKLPPPMNPREWLTLTLSSGSMQTSSSICTRPSTTTTLISLQASKKQKIYIVRGEISVIHEYERLPHNQTRITLRLKVDIKGSVPKKIANMGMSGAFRQVYRAYKYFQRDEEIDELEVSLIEMMNIMRGSNTI